ncbi:MAG TPA: hypothetical protein VGG62_17275 [Terracidiphilus sp.]
MNNDALMFAVIFIVATTLICAGVVMVALNRVRDAANVRPRKRGNRYRPAAAHRAFKDVV